MRSTDGQESRVSTRDTLAPRRPAYDKGVDSSHELTNEPVEHLDLHHRIDILAKNIAHLAKCLTVMNININNVAKTLSEIKSKM